MTLNAADGITKALEQVSKYSKSDAEKAIAAGILSMMADIRTVHSRLLAVEKLLTKK